MYDQTDAQVKAEKQLNKQKFRFSNWIPASPDAENESQDNLGTMVMVKKTGCMTEYREIDPEENIN